MTASLPLTTAGEEENAQIAAWAERIAAAAPAMPDQARARVRAALLDSLPDPFPARRRRTRGHR